MSEHRALLRIYTDGTALFGEERVYRVVAERARAAGLAGATVLQALFGFRGRPYFHARQIRDDDQSVVVEIVDEEARLRVFVKALDDLPKIGLITLDPVEVLRRPVEPPVPG